VPTISGVLKAPNPTAIQVDVLMHAISVMPSTATGTGWTLQLLPPFIDSTIESIPTEKHVAALGHATVEIGLMPKGED
jgi:hypothetical protein